MDGVIVVQSVSNFLLLTADLKYEDVFLDPELTIHTPD